MRIVSVAAPGNGSGKTLAISSILGAFPGRLTAVKFTTVFRDGVNCPRTETACACRSLHGKFTIVTDPAVLAASETDTGRLGAAGAREVFWCLARPGAHEAAWRHMRDLLPEGCDLITEGNTIIPVLAPDLLFVIMSPGIARARWKGDTWELVRRANAVVINRFGATEAEANALAEEVATHREGRRPSIEDVSAPLASWGDRGIRESVGRLLGGR